MSRVELVRSNDGVAGVVGEQTVNLNLDARRSTGGIRGTSMGVAVDGYWRLESNADTRDPDELFLGEYDGKPVFLRAAVHLTSYVVLRGCEVSGSIGDAPLTMRIAPVETPAYGSMVVGIDGAFSGEAISGFAAVNTDLSGIRIAGVIGAAKVNLNFTSAGVSGDYSGPPPLFPLVAAVPLYFC